MNSFTLDFVARVQIGAHLSLFILWGLPWPNTDDASERFLAHAALRLTANHAGYEPLWRSELGEVWREPRPPFTWPAVAGDDARWQLRAAIDAVAASAYGLDRKLYEHVLASFSHASYPRASELCLAAFDELRRTGLDGYLVAHDPYHDIPLVDRPARPVLDLAPPPGDAAPAAAGIERGGQMRLLPRDPGPFFHQREPEPTPPDDDAYARIAALLADRGVITSRDVAAATGLTVAEARPHLRRLVQEGKAIREGQARATRYRAREP